jgi:hypothetical protein
MIDFLAVFSRNAIDCPIQGPGRPLVVDVDGDSFRTTRFDRSIDGSGEDVPGRASLLVVERRPTSRRELRELVQGSTVGELHPGTVVWIHLGDLRAGTADLTRDEPVWVTRQRIAREDASHVLDVGVAAIWIESRVVNEATDFDFNEAFDRLCDGRSISGDRIGVLKDPPAPGTPGSDAVARLRAVVSHARHEIFRAVGPIAWNVAIGGGPALERASRECAAAVDAVRRIGDGLPDGRDLFKSDSPVVARWDGLRNDLSGACVRVADSLQPVRFGDGTAFRDAYRALRQSLQDATRKLDMWQDEASAPGREVTR